MNSQSSSRSQQSETAQERSRWVRFLLLAWLVLVTLAFLRSILIRYSPVLAGYVGAFDLLLRLIP